MVSTVCGKLDPGIGACRRGCYVDDDKMVIMMIIMIEIITKVGSHVSQ
jgi:hypothetical protein